MLRKLFALTVVTLLFVSCKKSAGDTLKGNLRALNGQEEKVLLTIKNLPAETQDFTFVVADLDGNVLTKQEYHTRETTMILKTTRQFSGSKINLFRIALFNNLYTNLFGTLDLDVNSDYYFTDDHKEPVLAKPLKIRLKDNSKFGTLVVSSDLKVYQFSELKDTALLYQMPFNRSINSDLFLSVRKQKNTYYRLFDINKVEEEKTEIDISKVNIKASKHKILLRML